MERYHIMLRQEGWGLTTSSSRGDKERLDLVEFEKCFSVRAWKRQWISGNRQNGILEWDQVIKKCAEEPFQLFPFKNGSQKKRTQSFLSNDNTQTETCDKTKVFSQRLWKSFKPVNLLCSAMAFKRCWVYVADLILMSFIVRILSLTLEKESLTTQCYLQKETTLYRRDTRHQAP